jgi:hypothetical protein
VDRPTSVQPQHTEAARWSPMAAVQAPLERGATLGLVAKRPRHTGTPRISCRELPGFCPARLYHHPLALVLMRWLLGSDTTHQFWVSCPARTEFYANRISPDITKMSQP